MITTQLIWSHFRSLVFSTTVVLSGLTVAATPLDINTATAVQLAIVMSGVGQSKADAIIEFRDQHGPFTSLDELTQIKGIGTATVDKNRTVLRVVPMNDVPDDVVEDTTQSVAATKS